MPRSRHVALLIAVLVLGYSVAVVSLGGWKGVALAINLKGTGKTTLISRHTEGTLGNEDSFSPSISGDGRYVVFSSYASNLVDDSNDPSNIFIHDRDTDEDGIFDEPGGFKTTIIESHKHNPNVEHSSGSPSITPDGRYVVFRSRSKDNNTANIYVHDRDSDGNGVFDETGTVVATLVSVHQDGTSANDDSFYPSITPDGRYVVFDSAATNLDDEDDNNATDVFVHDRDADEDGIFDEPGYFTTMLVSRNTDGIQGDDDSYSPSISADGRVVAFNSKATNLTLDNNQYTGDVFVHDRQTGQTSLVSRRPDGTPLESGSDFAGMSQDGRYIAFTSSSAGLVDDNYDQGLFVHDRQNGSLALISRHSNGTPGNGYSTAASFSTEGRFVAFSSRAPNLVDDGNNSTWDVFVHDRDTDGDGVYDESGHIRTTLVSRHADGNVGNANSLGASISANAMFVAFASDASNLVDADENDRQDVFVHELNSESPTIKFEVSGNVVDRNGNPIPDVTVSSEPGQETLTESDGTFELRLTPGVHTVTVTKAGYSFTPASQTIELTQDSTLNDFLGVLNTPLVDPIDNSDGNGTFVVRWSNVVNASQYELHEIGLSGTSQQIYVGPDRSYTVTGKGYGTWCYKVRALGPNGSQSEWSTLSCIEIPPCVPYFSQEDPRWASHPLRTDGSCSASCNTIGACGCTLTAATMLFAYYGADLMPNALSDAMGTKACPFYWGVGAAVTGGKATNPSKKGFTWLHLDNELNQNGRPVILGMSKGANTHWTLVTSGQGEAPANYLIHDPWPDNGPDTSLDVYRKQGWSFNSLVTYDGVGVCRPAPTTALHINLINDVQDKTETHGASVGSSALSRGNITEQDSITGSISVYHLNVDTVVVQLQASSENASIAEMQVWTDSQTSPQWQPYNILAWIPWEAENSIVYTRFRDNEGNTSQVFQDSMWPLIGPPAETDPEPSVLNLLPVILNR